jgi:hypothetical protein
VNTIHPHAVFDTGLWTDAVISERAAQYGLTAQQYRTRNVLGVEVASEDVAELVATMCGRVFPRRPAPRSRSTAATSGSSELAWTHR